MTKHPLIDIRISMGDSDWEAHDDVDLAIIIRDIEKEIADALRRISDKYGASTIDYDSI